MNVLPLPLPWLEFAILTALLGALCVRLFRDPNRAWGWGLAFTGAIFVCTVLACLGFYLCRLQGIEAAWNLQRHWCGRHFLSIDELNAPLLPLVGLLHFLTTLATGRTKMRRFSLSWSLASEALSLTIFGCQEPWLLIGLLSLGAVPGFVELRNRQASTRVYMPHLGLFVGLPAAGCSGIDSRPTADY
jgi:NADH-quinone oxidoreductase subunit M